MAAEMIPGEGSADPLPLGALRPTSYLGPVSSCPPEYADVPVRELFARIDAERQDRAAAAAGESLAAGFRPRGPEALSPPSRSGSGFESGGALDTTSSQRRHRSGWAGLAPTSSSTRQQRAHFWPGARRT